MTDDKLKAIGTLVEHIIYRSRADPDIHPRADFCGVFVDGLHDVQLDALDAVADLIHYPPAFEIANYWQCPRCGYRCSEELVPKSKRFGVACASPAHATEAPVHMTYHTARVRVR